MLVFLLAWMNEAEGRMRCYQRRSLHGRGGARPERSFAWFEAPAPVRRLTASVKRSACTSPDILTLDRSQDGEDGPIG